MVMIIRTRSPTMIRNGIARNETDGENGPDSVGSFFGLRASKYSIFDFDFRNILNTVSIE
jgi:hypothetical protein